MTKDNDNSIKANNENTKTSFGEEDLLHLPCIFFKENNPRAPANESRLLRIIIIIKFICIYIYIFTKTSKTRVALNKTSSLHRRRVCSGSDDG